MQVLRAATTTPTTPVGSSKTGIASAPAASVTAGLTVAAPLTGGQLISGSTVAAAYAQRADPDEDFAVRVDRETQDLADTLMKRLKEIHIPTDEPLRLSVNSFGTVRAEGPFKAKIEKLFADNPDLAKRLKDIAALNALVALNKVMRLHQEELKQAKNNDDRQQAQSRYTARCVQVETLSGNLTLADGKLFSAARGFADSLGD